MRIPAAHLCVSYVSITHLVGEDKRELERAVRDVGVGPARDTGGGDRAGSGAEGRGEAEGGHFPARA